MKLRCGRSMPSSEKHSDDGMVSVEIALGTFSIVIMIALVLSVFAAAMTTQNLCTALSMGIRESARGGNGQETAHVMSARISGAYFEFSADERWVYGKAQAPYRGPAGMIGLNAQCRYQMLRESTVVGGD